MTASNPCCLKCNGYRSEKYPKRPECNDQYCPCHRPIHVSSGGSREKSGCGLNHCDHTKCVDIPAAKFCECKFPLIDHSRNVDVCQACGLSVVGADWQNKEGFIEGKCCDLCWNSKLALHPRNEKKRIQSGCGFACFCHIERKVKLPTRNVISAHSKPQPEKDIEENLRLMNHGIIYQQPEKEWWDADDTRGAIVEMTSKMLDNPDEAGIYPTTRFYERMENFVNFIAAQSEKKGRNDAVDYILRHDDAAHPIAMSSKRFEAYSNMLERARSSEEGKTNNK